VIKEQRDTDLNNKYVPQITNEGNGFFSYCKSISAGLLCYECIKYTENQNILFEKVTDLNNL